MKWIAKKYFVLWIVDRLILLFLGEIFLILCCQSCTSIMKKTTIMLLVYNKSAVFLQKKLIFLAVDDCVVHNLVKPSEM